MRNSQKISRRDMLKYMGATVAGVAGTSILNACAPVAPQTGAPAAAQATATPAEVAASGKPITIATVGGTWKDWQDECVAQPFTANTGVGVVWDVQTPVNIIASMVASKKANQPPSHDLSKIDQFDIQFVTEQGLVSEMDKDIVTNWEDIHPNFRTDAWMTNHFSVYCMTWNTDRVDKEITSWFDMWDDTYKGKLAIPIFEWVGFFYLAALNTVLGGTPDNVDPAFEKLKEVVDTLEPKFMNSVEHGNQLFESEEIWIAPFWDGRSRNLQDNGLPIEYIYPDEGALANGSGFVIERGVEDNYRAANEFMNQVADVESQICFAGKINYPPTNVKIATMTDLPAKFDRLKIEQETMDKMLQVPWADYTARKSEYLDRWNREIAMAG